MGERIDAVIFDLDDTLYEHASFVRGAYRDVALAFEAETGLSAAAFESEAWREYELGGSRDNGIFSRLLKKSSVYSEKLEYRLVAAYRTHSPSIGLYPGVAQGLDALRTEGVKLGLLTDGRGEVQHRKILALGLLDAFDAIVITGEPGASRAKPALDGFAAVMEKLDTAMGQALMIGDDPRTDVAGALAAGIRVLRVRQGQYAAEPAPGVEAEFTCAADAIKWVMAERRRQ